MKSQLRRWKTFYCIVKPNWQFLLQQQSQSNDIIKRVKKGKKIDANCNGRQKQLRLLCKRALRYLSTYSMLFASSANLPDTPAPLPLALWSMQSKKYKNQHCLRKSVRGGKMFPRSLLPSVSTRLSPIEVLTCDTITLSPSLF